MAGTAQTKSAAKTTARKPAKPAAPATQTSPPDTPHPPCDTSGGEPMHWPDFWEELAPRWAEVQALQEQQVVTTDG